MKIISNAFYDIPFLTSQISLKTLDKKEENYKNMNISRTKRAF